MKALLSFSTLVLIALAAMTTVSGCNTTAGLGQDVQATGEAIEETAEDAKDAIND